VPGADLTTDDEILDWVKQAARKPPTTRSGPARWGPTPFGPSLIQLRVHGIAGPTGRRCLDHADADVRQYQCAVDHDRWKRRRTLVLNAAT